MCDVPNENCNTKILFIMVHLSYSRNDIYFVIGKVIWLSEDFSFPSSVTCTEC